MLKKIILTVGLTASLFAGPIMVMETNKGLIEIEMLDKSAPLAVKNFMTHSKNGYYDNLTFHRVIKKFMIQGGDPTGSGRGGQSIWKKNFKDEFKGGETFSEEGILAMANSGPNTNGSQFFITTEPTPWLNGKHTIFGKVIKGMNVVHNIEKVRTIRGNKPYVKQVIYKIYEKK